MLNLTRMELRRLFRGKEIYITLGAFFLMLIIAFLTMKLVTNPALTEKAVNAGFELSEQDLADGTEFLTDTKAAFVSKLLFQGGLMVTLSVIACAVITCLDFSSGTAKNIFSYLSRRQTYLLSKLLSNFILSGFFMAALTLFSFLLFRLLGFPNSLGSPLDLILMLLLGWICLLPILAQNLLFCMLLRRPAVSSILSVCLGLGIFALAADKVFSIFGVHVAKYLPPTLLLQTGTIGIQGFSGPFTFAAGGNMLLLLGLAFLWTVFYLLLASRVLNKKDIC